MKPQVSIVVPVYNAEKYLDQCIQSILNQDLGLDKIELVLVNDGSKDGSGKICERYAAEYPDNVVYIDQKNAGVSEARNAGVKGATGKYIGFVDADDYLSSNTAKGVMEYFKTAPKDVDVAIVRVVQFGHYANERSINAKFNLGTRTLDLNSPEWHDVYPRVAPSFIKSSVAKSHYFNKEISIYEDTRYMGEILAKSMKLGVVSRGIYYNRIHSGNPNASITTGAAKEKRFYMDSPKKVSLYLLEEFKGKKKYPPLFFQYTALYEMRWRLFHNPVNPRKVLSESEYAEYKRINKDVLELISDEAIVNFKEYNINQRIFLLNLKHSTDITKETVLNSDNELIWRGMTLFNYDEDAATRITDVYFSQNEVILKGFFSVPMADDIRVKLRIDGEERSDLITYNDNTLTNEDPVLFDKKVHYSDSFTARIPADPQSVQCVDFTLTMNGSEHIIEGLTLASPFRYGHKFQGNFMIAKKIGGIVVYPITSYPLIRRAMAKKRYLVKLIRRSLTKAVRICIRMIRTLR